MNTVIVSTDFNGREGLHTEREIRSVLRANGDIGLAHWAYANGIRNLDLRRMDGTHVTWILRKANARHKARREKGST
ncbi:MAG: hypothetical protein FJ279_03585 [Planctomycetes bacterium]|nr:hypothetical protein [Planctomycetota bacterium]